MSTITKAHTFTANTVANASSVNRDFDDIYNEFNGNINSANIASDYTMPSSQVSIVDAGGFYSSTTVEGALQEIAPVRGYNDVHVFARGSAGLSIFPGYVDINGRLNRLSSRLNITAISIATGAFAASAVYAVTFQDGVAGGEITASDIRIDPIASVSSSNGLAFSANGFYYSTSRRVITTVYNLCATSQSLYDYENLDTPDRGQRYNLSTDEASSVLGLTDTLLFSASFSFGTQTAGGIVSVARVFDMNTKRYYYDMYGFTSTATGDLSMTMAAGPAHDGDNKGWWTIEDGALWDGSQRVFAPQSSGVSASSAHGGQFTLQSTGFLATRFSYGYDSWYFKLRRIEPTKRIPVR